MHLKHHNLLASQQDGQTLIKEHEKADTGAAVLQEKESKVSLT